jgi:Predicted ATPase
MPKRIVITGGPGSGKTVLINHIKDLGYKCMHEISRTITIEAQKNGIDQLFLEDPILFSEKLMNGRLDQYQKIDHIESQYLFYDRGLPDITSYLDYTNAAYPEHFDDYCQINRYDSIFLLPPWKDIYKQDNERYESFKEAKTIYTFLTKGYRKYGYEIDEVPSGSLEFRTDYIFKKLKIKH